jgi:hypothetical protein
MTLFLQIYTQCLFSSMTKEGAKNIANAAVEAYGNRSVTNSEVRQIIGEMTAGAA